MYLFQSERLGLREWKETDVDDMAAINQNEQVMRFFPSIQDYATSKSFVERMTKHQANYGFCYFAVDLLETNEMIGFIGLCHQDYASDYTPHVDIGWRIAQKHWGKGYATEGAKACLDFAAAKTDLTEIYAVAPAINVSSENVMQKLGMEKVITFDHPKLEGDDRLKSCVLYRCDVGS